MPGNHVRVGAGRGNPITTRGWFGVVLPAWLLRRTARHVKPSPDYGTRDAQPSVQDVPQDGHIQFRGTITRWYYFTVHVAHAECVCAYVRVCKYHPAGRAVSFVHFFNFWRERKFILDVAPSVRARQHRRGRLCQTSSGWRGQSDAAGAQSPRGRRAVAEGKGGGVRLRIATLGTQWEHASASRS